MGLVKLSEESSVTIPASGYVTGYPDAATHRLASIDSSGNVTRYPYLLTNASVADVSGGFASDTYLAGSSITIPTAGNWSIAQQYRCAFDMVKTAAGTAALTITVRMGTLGTVSDAAILALAFAAGTAAGDTGLFEVRVTFRTVGSGTSAVMQGVTRCTHHLAATGLISTGASGTGIITGVSAGFNSTTQTIIGLSVNGGASFSGTNTLVQASLEK
jgi:hypothetical protein